MSLYRDYRPKTFDEVVGQKQVTTVLKNAIRQNSVSHAYLFTGPRGTGKTTTARLLAMAVNCQSDNKPCGKCESCQRIIAGANVDIREIDAATSRGIDNIRALREGTMFSPVEGSHKVYIIDEAHGLTKDASHALLKTLEEPPPNVIFILVTTEEQKLLSTIKSRCQVHHFTLLEKRLIINRLVEVCEVEGLKIPQSTLEFVTVEARGALRDALSILEVVSGLDDLSIDAVRRSFGKADIQFVERFVQCLAERSMGDAFLVVEELEQNGVNLESFLSDVEDWLHSILMIKSGIGSFSLWESIQEGQTESFTLQDIDIMFSALTFWRRSFTPFGRLVIEMAVCRACLLMSERKE